MLEKYLFNVENKADYPKAVLNSNAVGKSIVWIAKEAGFEVSEDTSIICVKCDEVGVNEPLTIEKLSPVLSIIKVKDASEVNKKSKQIV